VVECSGDCDDTVLVTAAVARVLELYAVDGYFVLGWTGLADVFLCLVCVGEGEGEERKKSEKGLDLHDVKVSSRKEMVGIEGRSMGPTRVQWVRQDSGRLFFEETVG
jgi:hypothetical protein